MDKIKCVIVEDEQHNMRLLESHVSKVERLELVGSFISPIELLNSSCLNDIQIIYLDIQMPNMTGVEFLKSVPTTAEVIFTTAYSEYAIEGYNLNVTDYLLKPIELPRFLQATNKAIENIELKSKPSESKLPEYMMLKVDKKLVKVYVKEIVYVQSDWNYVHVYTVSDKYMILSTLKNMEETLSKYQFIRIHKTHIINPDYFEFMEGNQVQVNGVKLQVGRSHKEELLKKIEPDIR